jgi:hypothetical protein
MIVDIVVPRRIACGAATPTLAYSVSYGIEVFQRGRLFAGLAKKAPLGDNQVLSDATCPLTSPSPRRKRFGRESR